MKPILTAAAILALGTLASNLAAQDADKPVWLESFQEGQAISRQTGKPIFLVFR